MSIQPETPDILLCPICHEKIEETDTDIPRLPCNHKFHTECLVNYCNHKNNHDVLCPLCRENITQSCNTINPITPFVNLHLDIDAYELPYSRGELANMSLEERRAAQNVITRIRRNFLARRRRAMSMETPQQLAQRFQIEEAYRNTRQAEQAALYAGGRKTKKSKAKRTKTKKKRKKLNHRR